MVNKTNVFYFGLEPLVERYTYQLCEEWMPNAFADWKHKVNFVQVRGENIKNSIQVGQVLDATGRGRYSLSQTTKFLGLIEDGKVHDNDVIFLQDFWTQVLNLFSMRWSNTILTLEFIQWYTLKV